MQIRIHAIPDSEIKSNQDILEQIRKEMNQESRDSNQEWSDSGRRQIKTGIRTTNDDYSRLIYYY